MDLKTLALSAYPYWILGIVVILATIAAGHRNVLRIEKSALLSFIKFICYLTLYRFVIFKLFPNFAPFVEAKKSISMVPIPFMLGVFWEDACHCIPLYFLKKVINNRKLLIPFYYIALAVVMVEFGMGHLYQGLIPSILLSFYVPYSVAMGEKYGFGTVMICHTIFDISTALSIQYLMGAYV